jgi:hypothetical protein
MDVSNHNLPMLLDRIATYESLKYPDEKDIVQNTLEAD